MLHYEIIKRLQRLIKDKGGNFALTAALASSFIILGIGMSIDYSRAVADRDHLQQALDAGLLAAMNKSTLTEQREVIENVLIANLEGSGLISADFDFDTNLSVVKNGDGSVTATLGDSVETSFMRIAGRQSVTIRVKSTDMNALTCSPVKPATLTVRRYLAGSGCAPRGRILGGGVIGVGLQPAVTLLRLDRHARRIDVPLERKCFLLLLSCPELHRRQNESSASEGYGQA
jgi:hypothetical protein